MKLKNFNIQYKIEKYNSGETRRFILQIGNVVLKPGDTIGLQAPDGALYKLTRRDDNYGWDSEYLLFKKGECYSQVDEELDYENMELISFTRQLEHITGRCYYNTTVIVAYNNQNNIENYTQEESEEHSPCGHRKKPIEIPEDLIELGFNTAFFYNSWCDSSD